MDAYLKKILEDGIAWLDSIEAPPAVDIPENVIAAMTRVRDSGQALFERQTAINQIGAFDPDAADWLRANPRAYNQIFRKLIGRG